MDEMNNEENSDLSTTDMNKVGSDNPLVSSSGVSDIIEATGNVNPTRFWMVFMIAISVGLGLVLFFGGGYLVDEVKSLKLDKELIQKEKNLLQVKLDECPEKSLELFKKQQEDFQDLKSQVFRDGFRLDSLQQIKTERLEKIKQIDKHK